MLTYTEFDELVNEMRAQQRAYFKTRSRRALDDARQLERRVDANLRGLLAHHDVEQGEMFEQEVRCE